MVEDAIKIIKSTVEKDISSDPNKSIVIIGHSMGGAVAARAAKELPNEWLLGVILLDIVEGSALEALPSMPQLLARRPKEFKSIQDAIKWSFSSNTIRNRNSARVSVPTQLVKDGDVYRWKVDLSTGKKYWKNWYTGLSSTFLGIKCSKLLMLAGTDRLDKDLTIGQMQGKFQLAVFNNVGHCLHEDSPKEIAAAIKNFIEHQKMGNAIIAKASIPS